VASAHRAIVGVALVARLLGVFEIERVVADNYERGPPAAQPIAAVAAAMIVRFFMRFDVLFRRSRLSQLRNVA
jgi:hypothetical protein